MKNILKITIFILGISLIFSSCNNDREEESNFLEGRYRFMKVTSNIPVDYNADGIFETDLTEYFKCRPALTFQKNGKMTYPSINVVIQNITIALGSGYVLEYEIPACETPEYNATYSVSQDKINVSTEWGDNHTYQLKNGIIVSNFNQANLVVDDGNGNKILERVNLEFQYSKN